MKESRSCERAAEDDALNRLYDPLDVATRAAADGRCRYVAIRNASELSLAWYDTQIGSAGPGAVAYFPKLDVQLRSRGASAFDAGDDYAGAVLVGPVVFGRLRAVSRGAAA